MKDNRKMRLTLLGTGTPWPSTTRQSTSNLVSIGSINILIDAGRGVTTQLAHLGMHPRDIDYIFLTHHHFDHISGIGDLLLSAWSDGRSKSTLIYGPPGTQKIIETLFRVIYARDIHFRILEANFMSLEMANIEDIFLVKDIECETTLEFNGWRISCSAVEHGHAMGVSHLEFPCYGYRVETDNKILAISGDAIDCVGVRKLANGADVLLQCCYLPEAAVNNDLRRVLVDLVLGSAVQANAIARACRVRKMILTHLSPPADEMAVELYREASENFSGAVIIGKDLMKIDV